MTPMLQPYEDRAAAMSSEAIPSALADIADIDVRFEKAVRAASRNLLDAANLSREAGIKLQALCGHEQMTFGFFESHCDGYFPLSFSRVQFHIKIARAHREVLTDFPQLAGDIQAMLITADMIEIARRAEPQTASETSVSQFVIHSVSSWIPKFKKAFEDDPIEQWVEDDIDDFLFAVKLLSEKINRAMEIKQSMELKRLAAARA